MGMELILTTDIEHLQPIEFNYESIKETLNVKLERYRNLVIEEKDVKDAKQDRAELNKLADALNSEKIRVKKQCLEPYNDFENKIKELIGMINQPASEIDKKVKEFEEAKKKEKREAVERFFKDNVHDLSGMLTLEKIYNPKWDNAGSKLMDITQEIMTRFESVQSDLGTIKSMALKHETAVISKYTETLNLGEAIKENNRLIAIETAAAEREAAIKKAAADKAAREAAEREAAERAEAEKAAAQAFTPAVKENPVSEAYDASTASEKAESTAEIIIPHEAPATPVVKMIDFRVWVTDEQRIKLATFLKANNIKYGKVPTEQKEAV